MRAQGSIRPGKPVSAMGFVVGIVFVGIGLVVVIPETGAFGVLWTFVAIAITAYHGYNLFSERGAALGVVDFETTQSPGFAAPAELSPEQRLARLDDLKTRGLVSEQEYSEQRKRILDEL